MCSASSAVDLRKSDRKELPSWHSTVVIGARRYLRSKTRETLRLFGHLEIRWMVHLADELGSMDASDVISPIEIANSIDPAINPDLDSISVARDTRTRMHALVQGGGNPSALSGVVREAHAILLGRYRERHESMKLNAQNTLRVANEARRLYKPELVANRIEMNEIESIISAIGE
jgi:hypothetical protein